MNNKLISPNLSFPLTYGLDTASWRVLQDIFHTILKTSAAQKVNSYSESKAVVEEAFSEITLILPKPIITDNDAKSILDTVFQAEEDIIRLKPQESETFRRVGRHLREHMADWLLQEHIQYLQSKLSEGDGGIKELAKQLGVTEGLKKPKSLLRFQKKIAIYCQVRAFVHSPELSLSPVKIKSRAGARAARGNLWPLDRQQKYAFLENLMDSHKVCPPFTEEDLEFLVSQSSLDMLQSKADFLINEVGFTEPNRLKANYSRLQDHLLRRKQKESDYKMRHDLLIKMGATAQQVDYISSRATYQTMKNLLKLANGKLAISDLMGGKRTIRKLMRRRGKAQSQAELMITRYLIQEEGISKNVAEAYARTRKNHSLEHLKTTTDFLKNNYRQLYKIHWGFPIQDHVLRRALELGMSRQKLSKRSLAIKDFVNDLRKALSIEEMAIVKQRDNLTPDARRKALEPLKEVLDCETDTDTRKQLFFIYEQFCRLGLCIPKSKLKEICLKHSHIFPSPRKVQDALEILNGAYRAIGQHGEILCVLPDYLRWPKPEGYSAYYPS